MSFQAVILIMSVLPLSRCPCQGNQNLRTDPIWSAKWSDRSLALVLALILEPIPSSMTDPSASLTARFIGWNALNRWKIGGLCFVFAWFFIGGIAHFALTRTEMRIVPSWLPSPHVIVLISGAFELLGAAGLIWWRTRRIAGIGLFALTLAVTPANIYMLQHPQLFGVPVWLLIARLPLQVALLGLIFYSAIARLRATRAF